MQQQCRGSGDFPDPRIAHRDGHWTPGRSGPSPRLSGSDARTGAVAGRLFLGAVLVAGVLALVVAGCARKQQSVTARSAPRWAGVTVRVAAPEGRPRDLLRRHGEVWAKGAGATLAVVAPPEGGTATDADLLLLPYAELPHWAAAGKLRPLRQADEVETLLPLYRSRVLHWEGTPYGLPALGDGPVGVYRADLFADAETQKAFREKYRSDLRPPATWDEYADQAEFFAARRSRPSLPPLPADTAGLTRAFYAAAAPLAVRAATGGAVRRGGAHGRASDIFSFQYDLDTGAPRVGDPGFVEALKLLQRLQPHRSKRASAAEALKGDEAVLGYVTLADLAGVAADGGGRWGVFRVPGSRRVYEAGHTEPAAEAVPNVVPYLGAGGFAGVVPQSAAQPDAAFDLLTYLASEGVSLEVVHEPELGGGPFRESHLSQQTAGWFNYGLDPTQTNRLRELMREVGDPRIDNPAVVLRIPDQRAHEEVLAAELRKALSGGGDPKESLAAVARRWRELDGDPNRAKEMYRKSVGLQQ